MAPPTKFMATRVTWSLSLWCPEQAGLQEELRQFLWSKYSLFHLHTRNHFRKAHTFLSEYVIFPSLLDPSSMGILLVAQVSGRADQDFEGSSGPSLIRGP